jgi:hypothetical protein
MEYACCARIVGAWVICGNQNVWARGGLVGTRILGCSATCGGERKLGSRKVNRTPVSDPDSIQKDQQRKNVSTASCNNGGKLFSTWCQVPVLRAQKSLLHISIITGHQGNVHRMAMLGLR